MATYRKHSTLSLSSLITLFKCCWLLMSAVTMSRIEAAALSNDASNEAVNWDHAVDLNGDFRVLWTLINQDIMFEIQVRTRGYVGFGFSNDGQRKGADMAVGWVHKGLTFFQDRFVEVNSVTEEPLVDPSQDYSLIFGYQNATHTVIRFRRKLQTCDIEHDIEITNSTMYVHYMYSNEDPLDESLPNYAEAWQESHPLILTQRPKSDVWRHEHTQTLELKNNLVMLPFADDSLIWCNMFTLDKIERKHHIIRYEPIFNTSWSIHYLQRITLYECQGTGTKLQEMAQQTGSRCFGVQSVSQACNAVVASWSRGSDGFSFPEEAGFPIKSKSAVYYLMETHYQNPIVDFDLLNSKQKFDASGLRLYLTSQLRQHDAGVLSIGMDPKWSHIIPPGQKRVVSEGHCLEDCTAYAFPPKGIHIFAAMMRTHSIGKEITLRHVRKSEELPPIVHENNINLNYNEFRQLSKPAHTLPGDRLVAECIYDSSQRQAITLGGLSMKEESCIVYTLYYPRQKKLTTCHSLPSLPTLLHSLGIEELASPSPGSSNPVVIASPTELKGMTLEERLLSYDWKTQFDKFQLATLHGTFKPICLGAKSDVLPLPNNLIGLNNPNITKSYKEKSRCKAKRIFVSETRPQLELPVLHDIRDNQIIGGSVRSSRSSYIETLALSTTSPSSKLMNCSPLMLLLLLALT